MKVFEDYERQFLAQLGKILLAYGERKALKGGEQKQ